MTPHINKYSDEKSTNPPNISNLKRYHTPSQSQIQPIVQGRMRRFSPEELAKLASDGKLQYSPIILDDTDRDSSADNIIRPPMVTID